MPRKSIAKSEIVLICIYLLTLISADHLFANDVKQEAVSWTYKYSFDNGIEVTDLVPITTASTRDGGFLLAGGDVVLKLNSLGRAEWGKSYYSCSTGCGISAIVESHKNGYLAASTVDTLDESYILLLRIDAGGNLIWSKRYRRDRFDTVQSLIRTRDGGYLLGAFSGASRRAGKAWLVKLGGSGAIQWQKTYNVARPNSIHQLKNGDYLVGTDQFSVLRLTRSGNVIFQKKFTGDGCCGEGVMRAVGENALVLAGNQVKNSVYSVVLLSVDSSGSILFSKTYANQRLKDLRLTSDGGYVILSRKIRFAALDKISITKIDQNGNVSWRRLSTSRDLSVPLTLLAAPDGGYIITSLDNFALKLDQFGNVPNACRNVLTSAATDVGNISMTAENRFPTVATTNAVPVIETNRTIDILPIVESICSP